MQIYVGDHRLKYVYDILFFTVWLSRFSSCKGINWSKEAARKWFNGA